MLELTPKEEVNDWRNNIFKKRLQIDKFLSTKMLLIY